MIKTSYYHHSTFIYTSSDYTFEIFMQVLFKMLTVLRFRPLLNTANTCVCKPIHLHSSAKDLNKAIVKKDKIHSAWLFPLSTFTNTKL